MIKLEKPNKKHITIAKLILIFPLAIGLFFFIGCFLSASKSAISFNIYILLAVNENKKKVTTARSTDFVSKNLPAKIKAVKTNIFFIQCFGLHDIIILFIYSNLLLIIT